MRIFKRQELREFSQESVNTTHIKKPRFGALFEGFNRLSFWQFQLAGWGIYLCADLVIMMLRSLTPTEMLFEAGEIPIGFCLSLLLREVYRRFDYQKATLFTFVWYIAFWSLVCTILWYGGIVALRGAHSRTSAYLMLQLGQVFYWIFFLSPVWLGWSAFYFGIKYWKDWENERQRARRSVTLARQAQLEMLRYQINPHFLFNALNAVRALIDEDRERAKETVTELSEFLRYSCIPRDHSEIPLRDEFDAIRHYLAIEKKRYEDKLEVSFMVSPEAAEFPVPSFLVHPLVENAIKYGMKTSALPLKIGIAASANASHLRIIVCNTGTWHKATSSDIQTADGTGTGLANIRARLENAYPRRHRFVVEQSGGGVQATIEIFNDTAT